MKTTSKMRRALNPLVIKHGLGFPARSGSLRVIAPANRLLAGKAASFRFPLKFSTNLVRPMTTSSIPPSKPTEDDSKQTDAQAVKPMGRFRELWHNYGVVFLGTYSLVYVVTLGSVFELVSLKHIDAKSAVHFLHGLGVDNYVDLTPIATSKAGNFALAWVLTKFTEPLRLAFTVTITPSLARLLGRAPPKKSKLPAGSTDLRDVSSTARASEGAGGL